MARGKQENFLYVFFFVFVRDNFKEEIFVYNICIIASWHSSSPSTALHALLCYMSSVDIVYLCILINYANSLQRRLD